MMTRIEVLFPEFLQSFCGFPAMYVILKDVCRMQSLCILPIWMNPYSLQRSRTDLLGCHDGKCTGEDY